MDTGPSPPPSSTAFQITCEAKNVSIGFTDGVCLFFVSVMTNLGRRFALALMRTLGFFLKNVPATKTRGNNVY